MHPVIQAVEAKMLGPFKKTSYFSKYFVPEINHFYSLRAEIIGGGAPPPGPIVWQKICLWYKLTKIFFQKIYLIKKWNQPKKLQTAEREDKKMKKKKNM